MTTFTSKFSLGERVAIDGGRNVIAIVIGFCFYARSYQVQVSWWNSGTLVEQWIDDTRLTSFGE